MYCKGCMQKSDREPRKLRIGQQKDTTEYDFHGFLMTDMN